MQAVDNSLWCPEDGIELLGILPIRNSLLDAKKAKGVGGDSLGFCPTVEVLESGVSCCVVFHSPLKSPQYWSKLCFRVPPRLQKDRLVGGGMRLVFYVILTALSVGDYSCF